MLGTGELALAGVLRQWRGEALSGDMGVRAGHYLLTMLDRDMGVATLGCEWG